MAFVQEFARRVVRSARRLPAFHRFKARMKQSLYTICADQLPNVVPLNLDPRDGLEPKLNVLIPGMAMRHMSGGPNTAINLTYRLAAAGVPIRYISTCAPLDTDQNPLWNHFASLTGINERLSNVEMACNYDRKKPLVIGKDDVFYGTAWWTVQLAKLVLPRMNNQRFMYMIQDYEPCLYPWSTAHALAAETYTLDYHAVICGQLLSDYLRLHQVGNFSEPEFCDRALTFEPAVDSEKFRAPPDFRRNGKKQLLFYARPNAPRNLFEIGLVALKQAVLQGAFPVGEWELRSMGEPLPEIPFGNGQSLVPHPWVDYRNYADLLRKCDVGLSLMLSPHSSYPPLEMAACGASVVTNVFDVKTANRLHEISSNLLPVTATLEGIVAGLKAAAARTPDYEARRAGAAIGLASDWDEVFSPLVPQLVEMWNDCRAVRRRSAIRTSSPYVSSRG